MAAPFIEELVQDLSNRLSASQPTMRADSDYYEALFRPKALGVATPPEMRHMVSAIGWPRVYLDSLEERLDVEGFRLAGSSEADQRLWSWWQINNLDEESSIGHLEAMIYGLSYVTVTAPDETAPDQDTPVIRVESPRSAIADIDHRTGAVRAFLRLYPAPAGEPTADEAATLMVPGRVYYLVRSSGPMSRWRVESEVEGPDLVPVVPILNRERLSDRMGRSEILPEIRSVTDAAARTMMNLQAAAELMAVPQRLLFGVTRDEFESDPDNPGPVLDAYYARIMAFENEAASATQFTAAELRNFTDVLDQLAKQVAAYTGLPPQYLSFHSDNPASAEAIRSAESRLVKKAERKCRMFGGAWEQTMRIAMLIMDGEIPQEAYRMETLWRDPATPTYAAKADAVVKLVTAVTPDGRSVIPVERGRIDLGYSEEELREMEQWDNQSPTAQLNALMSVANPPLATSGSKAEEE
ncbi:phage portal protein [Saccharopolyspora indica]|uniref:phage portal protein n=1 Tax=Saccharopolyspora indica TaxID=1229659 RepID=UPI0022EB420E|nr:phage portal protein [Saccharopolyspora indica]MDA3643789.1 phage portal protein [Saccharopolyspora indica]